MAGLRSLVLSRDWNKHKEGDTVKVDDARAKWLIDNEYVQKEEAPKRRVRTSKSKK